MNVNPKFAKYIITDEQREQWEADQPEPQDLPAYAQKIMPDGEYAGKRLAGINNSELRRLLNQCEDNWDELCPCFKLVLRDRAVGGVQ